MKDLQKLFAKAYGIVIDCGIVPNHTIKEVKVNTRAKTIWGKCTYKKDEKAYVIEISSRILQDEVPTDATISTIIHEILHCTDSHGHDARWRKYANKVMQKYPQYTITRCSDASKFNLEQEQVVLTKKYACQCDKCGVTIYRTKMSKFVRNPENFLHMGCGGHFKRINLGEK